MRLKAGITVAFQVSLFAAVLRCAAQTSKQGDLRKELATQGFTGPLVGKVHFDQLGFLHCGPITYRACIGAGKNLTLRVKRFMLTIV